MDNLREKLEKDIGVCGEDDAAFTCLGTTLHFTPFYVFMVALFFTLLLFQLS